MRALFIGDIVGKAGRTLLANFLPGVIDKYKIDFVVANGENAAGGFGITEKIANEIFKYGVNVITTGNHVWDKKEVISFISQQDRLLRPLNYPQGVPGFGSVIYPLQNGLKVAVINLSGRVFMSSVDCPFTIVKPEVERIKKITNHIIIDMHAEATSEKIAMGFYLDGTVTAIIGTHTHVQTADEKILPKNTAYITDVGMTGPLNSVLGVRIDQVIDKFLTQMPKKFDIAKGKGIFSTVIIDIDRENGNAKAIKRLNLTGGD